MKKPFLTLLIFLIITFGITFTKNFFIDKNLENNQNNLIFNADLNYQFLNNIVKSTKGLIKQATEEVKGTTITITAVGDCTIGYDDNFGYHNSFNYEYDKNGAEYFFENVKEIFEKDDLTIINLESTFTDHNQKRPKKFNFKAPYNYVDILNKGNIELVNLANNHTYDYGEIGYVDTKNTLQKANINYFGNDNYYIYEKNNIKIGFAGIFCIEWNCTNKVDKAIAELKAQDVDSIVLSFHWGIEKDYKQSNYQTKIGHYSIDKGADLIIGHHPHVLQGIEKYKDKYIVYSLANFSFGGNKNPSDKDTMIFQISFLFKDNQIINEEVRVYPASVSSISTRNDYRPTLVTGDKAQKVLEKIQKNSIGVNLY